VSTVVVKRLQRRAGPALPDGEIILPPPPAIPANTGRGWSQVVMMLPMLGGSAAMALMFTGSRGSGPLSWVIGGLFGMSAVGMLGVTAVSGGGQSKAQLIGERRDYLRMLSQLRRRVRRNIEQQRAALTYQHPEPEQLWCVVPSHRLWERRSADLDFGVVRVGIGPADIVTPLVPPETQPMIDLEPLCAQALRRFVTTYAVVEDLPIAMAVNGFGRVYIQDSAEAADRRPAAAMSEPAAVPAGLVRALIAQLVTFHAPEDLRIAVCAAPERRDRWEWVKWLPHATHPSKVDALGPVRLVASTVTTLEAILDDVLANRPRFNPAADSPLIAGPHLVVVLDGGDIAGSDHLMTEGGVEGVTLIDLSTPPPRLFDRSALVLHIEDGQLTSTSADAKTDVGVADILGLEEARALARALAPLRLSAASKGGDAPMAADLGLSELLDIGDPYELDPATTWLPRPNRDRLRVPIGVGPDGTPVELDLKESAQDGMGPHGLLIGATGSGKSELLRTLVLALAITHPSETLNFVLVDFKGGATFTKLDRLPHTSAVITNLVDELPLVDRMTDAINGELVRRQELLRKAGSYVSQRDYEKARIAGAPLDPLPSLLILCDEFSELLSAKPDFIDMFVQIGRVGRSLGVHLLLASQRLEEGRLRGLDTHLSYRIGLRTFSAMESRVVLGVNDAYELPRAPGHGYLKTGTSELERFRAAYVSGVHRSGISDHSGLTGVTELQAFSTQYVAPQVKEVDEKQPVDPDEGIGESLLDILVGRLQGRGAPAHQVWLPPLKEPPTLDQVLPPLVTDSARGLTVAAPDLQNALTVPVGVVDKPYEQRRDLLWLDLAGSSGNVVLVGGPQSGKSTLLRSLMVGLALTHTPRETQMYCLDFGGGALASLRDLPHVGGVATRLDAGDVRRTVAEMHTLLLDRERLFAANGIDGMASYRRLRRAGRFNEDQFCDVFLVIDNWLTLRNDFDDLEPTVTDIANRGLSYGIHVVVTATRWLDLRPAIRDVFGTRLELRLGDPTDSYIDRRAAMNVPSRAPGRGITPDRFQFLAALPRLDGRQAVDDLGEGVTRLVKEIRNGWSGPEAPRVRLLPAIVPYESLPVLDGQPGIPIGIAESDLAPVRLDFEAEPHFLLFGDAECGKSAFLRALARSLTDRYTPREARIVLIDYRRSLLGAVASEHLIGYGTSAAVTQGIVDEIVGVMADRLPGPDVTPEQLRSRSWWRGPELYVLIDDYDLVANPVANPVAGLLEYVPQGKDIGLHVIATRRSGGAGRAMYEPFIQRLREVASPGLVMSGDKDEGALLGSVKPQHLPAGRGYLVTRRDGARLIQLGWLPPAA
jgi:S-DNA-T family DNA segregation ATPase FtsK/SpoIIIE